MSFDKGPLHQEKSDKMHDQAGFVPAPEHSGWHSRLHMRISNQLPAWRGRVTNLVRHRGSHKIDEVTIEQAFGGMRGVQALVSDISNVDPSKGLLLRGYTIDEVLENLPRIDGSEYPLAGGLYFLLLVGELPNLDEAMMVEDEWKKRSRIPEYVIDVIRTLPIDTHPMTLFSTAILSMQRESLFAYQYQEGIAKTDYWQPTLEDSLNLTAKLPALAAFIYNLKYRGGEYIAPDPDLDWSANFARMIGKDVPGYYDLCRLFFVLHADHELGNASAHASHLVGSTLSDVYYSSAAGMTALAGPLHGLANQGCLNWLLGVMDHFNGELPTRDQIEDYVLEWLRSGRVIPGYGHAVLRRTDPRFMAQIRFGKKHLPDDPMFQLVRLVYDVVPRVLAETGKVSNPWPNVDAANGTLQYYFGVREFDMYTVLFGTSRILGLTANVVWARALGQPIERPKSTTTERLEQMAGV